MTTVSIGTVAELQAFATRVNAGETDLDAILTADIDLTDVSWTPIGTSSNAYSGTFDGNGKTISNLYLHSSSVVSGGIFGYVSAATIQNLAVDGVDIELTTSQSRAGGIVGVSEYATVISNCAVSGASLISYSSSGGIVGASGTDSTIATQITNCYATGTLLKATRSGSSFASAGGIVGFRYSTVSNCYAKFDLIIRTGYPNEIKGWGVSGISTTQDWNSGVSSVSNSVSLSTLLQQGSTTNNNFGRISPSGAGSVATYTNNYGLNPTNTLAGSTSGTITSGSLSDYNGANVLSSEASSETWWTTTSGLGWDFTDTWYWDTTDSLPKLQVFQQSSAPTVKVFNATSDTWVDGTPYVFNGTSWVEADAIYVYVNGSWVEKT